MVLINEDDVKGVKIPSSGVGDRTDRGRWKDDYNTIERNVNSFLKHVLFKK